MPVICHVWFCQATAVDAQDACSFLKPDFARSLHSVRVPIAKCGAYSVPRQVLPGHCTMFWCTVQNACIWKASQVLPGHRAAALLQNFLPLVCHLASAFCSNLHFQTIFLQISISSANFPICKFLLQQHPSVVKCFNEQTKDSF